MSDDERTDSPLSPPTGDPEAGEVATPANPETPAEPAQDNVLDDLVAAVPPRAAAPPPPPPPPPVGPYAAPSWQAYGQWHQPPPRRRSGASWIIVLSVLIGIGFILLLGYLASDVGGGRPSIAGLSHVGVIPITGMIRDGGQGGLFAGPPGARGIMSLIRAARKDTDAKAILILINSPGGSPAASHAIWQEVMELRKHKKVVVCMTDVCASGGYYIASAADRIVAQGSTLTGSIGVIMGGMGYYGLMQKLGLTDQTITAGKYKDAGSGQRPLRPEEKAYLQSMLQDVYSQFISAVAEGRKLDPAKVRKLAEGRIYTGKQAKAVGLVDELGNFYDAVKVAGKLAGIKGEPRLKYYGESRSLFDELTASESIIKRLFGARSPFDELPLQGPMLVVPYAYHMVPAVTCETFDLR